MFSFTTMLIWEGGGICINIYFFYHMENVEHNNWSGKCGNGAKRSEIRNQGIEAPKIWNQGIEAQKIWNQGIEAQKIWNLGYGYPWFIPPALTRKKSMDLFQSLYEGISRDAMGWYVEVEYSSIFIFVSVTWGYTDTESTWCQFGIIEQIFLQPF